MGDLPMANEECNGCEMLYIRSGVLNDWLNIERERFRPG